MHPLFRRGGETSCTVGIRRKRLALRQGCTRPTALVSVGGGALLICTVLFWIASAPAAAQVGPPDVIYAKSVEQAIVFPDSPSDLLIDGNRRFVLLGDSTSQQAAVAMVDELGSVLIVSLGMGIPTGLAITADGDELWVSIVGPDVPNTTSKHRVAVIDVNITSSGLGSVIDSVELGGKRRASGIVRAPLDRMIVLDRAEQQAIVLDRETRTPLFTIALGFQADAIAVSSDLGQLVAAGSVAPYLRTFDLESLQPLANWGGHVGVSSLGEIQVVVGPDARAYWIDSGSGDIGVVQLTPGAISTLARVMTTGSGLGRAAVVAGGSSLLVSSPDTFSLVLIDLDVDSPTAYQQTAEIPTGESPFGVGVDPQISGRAWVTQPAVHALASVSLPIGQNFVRGDCSGDGEADVGDSITILTALFDSVGEISFFCEDACDANDDGSIDLGDVITGLDVLFGGTGGFAAPYPDCGLDPTADFIPCFGSLGCP